MKYSDFEDKKVYLWGTGVEGQFVLSWWNKHFPGRELVVIDDNVVPNDAEIIIKSPGVSYYLPTVKEAFARGVKFTSAINIYLANKPARTKTIGVTGTKGKSTTSSLLFFLLEKSGRKVGLAGNIGLNPLDYLDQELDYVILELSSFHIKGLSYEFDYIILLNISRAHLDWHLTVDNYFYDKFRVINHGKRNIINYKNPKLRKPGAIYYETDAGFYVEDYSIYYQEERLDVPKLKIIGEHNLSNICACLTLLKEEGLDYKKVLPFLSDFEPLDHRLQKVYENNGICYVDDSIATVPDSVIAALKSFDKPIVLIAGGYGANQDYTELDRFIESCDNVKMVAALPDTGSLFKTSKAVPVKNMEEAVAKAIEKLKGLEGVVLLSPAAPSYNMYENYIARGNHFAELARKKG